MWKIFVKDLMELYFSRRLVLFLLVVPMVLIGMVGQLSLRESKVRVAVVDHPRASPTKAELEMVLADLALVQVVDVHRNGMPIWDFMAGNRLDLALVWESPGKRQAVFPGVWYAYSRPLDHEAARLHAQLIRLLQQGVAGNQVLPWWVMQAALRKEDVLFALSAFPILYQDGMPPARSLWLVPRATALILVFAPFVLASVSLIRERETGTFTVIALAPRVGRLDIILGKTVLPMLVGLVLLLVLTVFARILYGIGLKPGFPGAAGMQLLAALCATFQGLLVSVWARSQYHALLVSAAYLVALAILTGFSLPIDQASPLVQTISRLLPLTFSQPPFTAWMNHGTEAERFLPELLWLVGLTAVSSAAAVGSFFRSVKSL